MTTTPRLRFAPSPTGYLHVGGARTALFNWLFAKKFGGKFLLRVEDTDKARSTDDSTKAIFDGLDWLGLRWDEEVVFQGANAFRHYTDALQMVKTGTAYRCFCSKEELDARRETASKGFKYDRRCANLSPEEVRALDKAGTPFVVRFKVPEGTTSWEDLIHGEISFPNADIEDFIILRTDGTPIYNLAVVSDDIDMRITHVLRGDDHISNTPKQIMLYNALGAELPIFGHMPMIHGRDGKKLSKRHGATAVGDYSQLGILPDAMLNFLALLGWSPGNDIEVMTRDEMIALFETKGLQKKAAIFDPVKLEWMNGQHLSRTDAFNLAGLLMQDPDARELIAFKLFAPSNITPEVMEAAKRKLYDLIDLLKTRARTTQDLVRQLKPYLADTIEYDADAVAKVWKDRQKVQGVLVEAATALQKLDARDWHNDDMETALRKVASLFGYGDNAGKLFQPLRVALTGLTVSPGIFDVMLMLGRDKTLARLDAAVAFLTEVASA